MNAKDVMTAPVVTVGADSSVAEVANVLLTHGISAAPVVDGGKLVGIVSEGDLIRRAEIGTSDGRRGRWRWFFTDSASLAAEYVKSHSMRVRDVMTRQVVAVAEDTPLTDIVITLEKHRIKRVPVVRGGRLVGIVSRANLVQGLMKASAIQAPPAALDDSAIREQVLERLRRQPWSTIGTTNVTVNGGVVEYRGLYGSQEEREAERVAAENVPGVRRVEDHRMSRAAFYDYG